MHPSKASQIVKPAGPFDAMPPDRSVDWDRPVGRFSRFCASDRRTAEISLFRPESPRSPLDAPGPEYRPQRC